MANMVKWVGKASVSFLALLIIFIGTLKPEPAYAGWKTKAALTAGTILAGQAIKRGGAAALANLLQPAGRPVRSVWKTHEKIASR
jgi:hypothetical protein